jgi:hypothetical protein
MKSERKANSVVFDPDDMNPDHPDYWYMSISELAEITRQSRETVSRQLSEHNIGSPGTRRGYPVYHLPTLALSNQTGIRRRLECSKCRCRRCSLLRQT